MLFRSQISQHALEHFTLTWAQADFRAYRSPGIQQFLRAPPNGVEQACTRHNEDCVIGWSLAANETVHGEEAGRPFDRQSTLRCCLDFKSRRPGCSLTKNESPGLQRVYFCGNRVEYRIGPCLIQNDLALSESPYGGFVDRVWIYRDWAYC